MKTIIFYETVQGKTPLKDWIGGLRDKNVIFKIQVRFERIERGNFGDYKNLGKGLFELRFSNGIRIYYAEQNETIVVLFCGGNKSSQSKDIQKARLLLKEMTAREGK